jgi:hypothetical protein
MANEFSKEEKVQFDEVLEGYHDALVLSHMVSRYSTDATNMARQNDVIWRPMPYIAQSYDGTDATSSFGTSTQLSVPSTIGFHKHSAFGMEANEYRDALQEGRLGDATKQKLASDVNTAVMAVAANQGTVCVKRSAAASGYSDLAECDAVFNELGVGMGDRYVCLSSRDYNGMAANLAARETMNEKPTRAYEKSYVGDVAGFETHKLDYANRLTAAAGGGALTIDTQAAATNYHTPVATRTSATGETGNVDNRYQTITISATTNVAAGDSFTIAGVNAVHHITKDDTGQLKTFRVISVDSGTTMTISPAIVSNQGGTDAEAAYQNVSVTESATAAIVFLNTVTASVNPFWHKDAIEVLPSSWAIQGDSGVATLRASLDNGFEVVMSKGTDINTGFTKLRYDTQFGVVMKQPEMAGIMQFSQT